MKKLLTVAAALLVVAGVSAKKPMAEVLPTCGDFALSIDATPLFKYVGGIFSDTDANSGRENGYFGNDLGIMGKYFVQPDRAIRFGLDLGFNNNTITLPPYTVGNNTYEDKEKYNDFAVTLYGGYEWRRGYNRLQGFYGLQGMIGYAKENTKYEYGQAISADNPVSRDVEDKGAGLFSFGAGAFVGVEYFFLPKVSMAGEVGFGVNLGFAGKSEYTSESWNAANNRVESTTVEGGKATSVNVGTTNWGKVSLNFHF